MMKGIQDVYIAPVTEISELEENAVICVSGDIEGIDYEDWSNN